MKKFGSRRICECNLPAGSQILFPIMWLVTCHSAHGMHMVCTWYAHVTFVMATLPESAFQSSNLIGLVRGVVRATMHIHIYNVVAYIHVYII